MIADSRGTRNYKIELIFQVIVKPIKRDCGNQNYSVKINPYI